MGDVGCSLRLPQTRDRRFADSSLKGDGFELQVPPANRRRLALSEMSPIDRWHCQPSDRDAEEPMVCRLTAGGRRIRTISPFGNTRQPLSHEAGLRARIRFPPAVSQAKAEAFTDRMALTVSCEPLRLARAAGPRASDHHSMTRRWRDRARSRRGCFASRADRT